MKRFISLFALAIAPVVAFSAEAPVQTATPPEAKSVMCGMKDCFMSGPVSATDETWAARTQLDWGKHHGHGEGIHLNTIQPLYRSDDMRSTTFIQGGIGLQGSGRKGADLGLGYRYLTVDTNNMFGANMFYNGKDFYNLGSERHGYRLSVEWFTPYTTLSLGRHLNRHAESIGRWKTWQHLGSFNKAQTTLDLEFQLPYLPWASMLIGKDWNHGTHLSGGLKKLDYSLNLNLISCLSLEAGYHNGWNKHPFARLIMSFGRAASAEHTIADKLFGDEAFTARDLRNYTLAMPSRTAVR